MKKRSFIILILILCLLIIIFCLIYNDHKNKNHIPYDKINNAAPQQVVKYYYESIKTKDYKTASLCLSKEYADFERKVVDSDFNNIRKITDVIISSERHFKIDNKYYDEVQICAEYNAIYKKEMTRNNGKRLDFIYVAKESKNSPWKIVSIGTGP